MGRAKFKTIPTDFESAAALKGKTIAYATTVTRPSELEADVLQHGNVIATYTPEALTLNNCGWDSVSTSHRLDTLLTAYLGTFQSYRVHIHGGQTCLTNIATGTHTPANVMLARPDGTVIA